MEIEEKTHFRWPLLGCLFLINLVFNGILHMIMPPLFPEISRELGLTYTDIGSAWGAHSLGMLFFSLMGGVFADRFGVKNVLSIALVFASLFSGIRGWVATFWELWATMFLLGASYGFIIPNLTKCVGIWFDRKELGRANGILLMGFSIGTSFGVSLGAPFGNLLGSWRYVMFCSGFLGFVVWLFWMIVAREPERHGPQELPGMIQPRVLTGLTTVFRVRDFWLICLSELFLVGCFIAIMGLMPIYLVDIGVSENRAGLITSLSAWASIFGYFFGPYLSDRFGFRKTFSWPFLFAYAICIALVAFLRGWSLYIIWGLAGFIHACAVPIMRSIVTEIPENGPDLSGSAFGGIFTLNRIGGFALPWVMGLLMTVTGMPSAGFHFAAVLSIIPPILIFFVRETGPGRRRE